MSKLSNASLLETERPQDEQLVEEAQAFAAGRSAARLDRRRLITNLSMAAGAAGVLGMTGCSTAGPAALPPANTTPSVLDVLNFALNLEYFEATFYSVIVTGTGLSAANMGTGAGVATGGQQVTFKNSFIANIAANLMMEEVQHVEFLRATIAQVGGTPVPMPNLYLAALGAPTDDASFVALARTIEGVGVSAYAGGAQYLTSNTAALTYAAQILDTESQHEGALRQACVFFPGGAITSTPADSMDMPPTITQLFNTGPTTGLVPVRTISQVLQIVYGTPGVTGTTQGGFFPSGFNGNIYIS